uniref:Uncharacterized protein n=1 Tax=Naja naja TaxID=35670 RepID=A0A8C7DYX0_NAJNA
MCVFDLCVLNYVFFSRYEGPLLDEDALNKAAECGLASKIFVSFKASPQQLVFLTCGEDVESLQLEMSGFLKELACPYSTLVSGEIKDRLKKKEDCLKVLCKLVSSLLQYDICLLCFLNTSRKERTLFL